jgi:hypothetical protein
LAIALDLIMHGVGARSSSPGQVTTPSRPIAAELLGILQVAKTPAKETRKKPDRPFHAIPEANLQCIFAALF